MASAPTRPALRMRFEKKRAEVLEACAQVFAERGYDGAGIEDLSAATGLAAGGLYHYIGSKEQALFEIFSQLMDPLLKQARAIEAESSRPATDRLHHLLRLWVEHVAAHRDHMLVFSQERHILERDPQRWRQIRDSRRRFERLLAGLLDQAAAELDAEARQPGPAAPPSDSASAQVPEARAATRPALPEQRLVLLALLGMVNYAPQWLKSPGPLRTEQIADGYYSMVLRSLS